MIACKVKIQNERMHAQFSWSIPSVYFAKRTHRGKFVIDKYRNRTAYAYYSLASAGGRAGTYHSICNKVKFPGWRSSSEWNRKSNQSNRRFAVLDAPIDAAGGTRSPLINHGSVWRVARGTEFDDSQCEVVKFEWKSRWRRAPHSNFSTNRAKFLRGYRSQAAGGLNWMKQNRTKSLRSFQLIWINNASAQRV